jgi:xylulokinase
LNLIGTWDINGKIMNYLSIDLGTTKIKASLFNKEADTLHFLEIASNVYNDDGIYQKPDDYFNSVIKIIKELKIRSPLDFKNIGLIIMSGQMGGTLGVDSNLEVVFPWTYSVDLRYLKYVYDFESRFGKEIREKSGGPPTIAGKIKWIREEFPKKYGRIKKFINLMGYVSSRLCGITAKDTYIDCTCLSMSGIADIKEVRWDEGLCRKMDIEMHKLPRILLPFEKAGSIPKNKFGTNHDIEVLSGCGDQVAGFIGSGLIDKNEIIDVSGTYNLIGYCCEKFVADSKFNVFHSIYSGISNIYYQLGVVSAGGYTFDWFLKSFNYIQRSNKGDYKVPSNIFLTPYFGGRYSPTQPYFKGGILNLEWSHGIDDIFISLLESGGYEINSFVDALCELNDLDREIFKEIKIIGSGAKNKLENYIKANILNLKYIELYKKPFENLGTYIIARYKEKVKEGVKYLTDKKVFDIEESILPEPNILKYYKKNILKYKKIVKTLNKLYKSLDPI